MKIDNPEPGQVAEGPTWGQVVTIGEGAAVETFPIYYGDQHCGPGAVVRAVIDALGTPGRVVRLGVGTHPNSGGKLAAILSFGVGDVDGVSCLRWTGEAGKPNGASSSSVIPTWYPEARLDPASLSAVIAWNAGKRGQWAFRLPDAAGVTHAR